MSLQTATAQTNLNQLQIINKLHHYISTIIRPRRSRSAVAYGRQTFPWTICTYVCAYVCPSVCPVHCAKTADRIRMLFGIVGQMGPGMMQVWGSVHGKWYFWGEFGARHCNQGRLYGVHVQQRRDTALFPNNFGQTCY